MVRPSSARVEIKSQWELVVRLQSLQTGFSSWCFHSSQKYLLLLCSPQKDPRGLCSIEQLPSTDHERRFRWFGMNSLSHHYTTQHKGMNRTGSWTVGVDSLGRAGSSYHTATMAASRNITDGFALRARKPHCGGRLLLVEVKTKPVRLEDGVSNWCRIRLLHF